MSVPPSETPPISHSALNDASPPYFQGKILLAMPTMNDQRFHKAVIFICNHDHKGAMGLVINNPLHDMSMEALLKQLKFTPEANAPLHLPVMAGGPVDTQRGFLLHPLLQTGRFNTADTIIVNRYGISSTLDALREVAAGTGPDQLIFALGYAGWSAGQLEQEIQDNAWLVMDADDDLLFQTQAQDMWSSAMIRMGIKTPAFLSYTSGSA